MLTTFHLLHDLGIRKAAIVKVVAECENNDEKLAVVEELIERRTQHYTVEELRALMGFYVTVHDECVDEFPEDYTALEVHTARAKIARYDEAMKRLDELAGGPGYPTAIGDLRLVADTEKAEMFGGPTGTHTIYRAGMLREEWTKRVKAHWAGYCQNNGEELITK